MTCRERYNEHIAELIKKEHCSVDDDEDGEPLVPYQPCTNIDDCEALWEALCEECPRADYTGLERCKNADSTYGIKAI